MPDADVQYENQDNVLVVKTSQPAVVTEEKVTREDAQARVDVAQGFIPEFQASVDNLQNALKQALSDLQVKQDALQKAQDLLAKCDELKVVAVPDQV